MSSPRSQLITFGLAVIVPVLLVMFFLPGISGRILSAESFMPHAHCYLNDPRVIWLHVLSDAGIGTAYVAISSMLAYLVYKARKDIPFQWMFLAFGLFIISCGMTHFMEVVTVWRPVYWLSGDLKLLTATASLATAFALPPLLPRIFALIHTAKASEERKLKLEVAHREMEEMNRQLRELDELKSQFFANVSHELRTPLALILGPTQRLLATQSAGSPHRRELEVVNRNALLLLKHVNDLLDTSKLDAGKMQIVYQTVDLAALIRLVCSNFEVLAAERSISLRVDCPTTLPIQADLEKTERVVVNLLANAFKFTPAHGKISCSLRVDAGRALLTVADNGPGVPADFRDAIFERFRQLEGGATRRFGGTGLGLAIAKEFIEMHGGEISVTDAPGGGALFTVSLPLRAPAGSEIVPSVSGADPTEEIVRPIVDSLSDPQTAAATSEARPASAAVAIHPEAPLVLVIEDNADMNRFLRDVLNTKYRTEPAHSGVEGWDKARSLDPDLILTDVMMPEMSGDQLLRALRKEPQFANTPVVLVTAKSDDELRVELLRQGAQDYVTKPFVAEELLARVGNLLNARFSRRALERANEELETFSYSISHDLRTPLRAMKSYAEIMLTESSANLDPAQVDYLQRIERAAARMDQLIQDVLGYTRLARAPLELVDVPLEPLLREFLQENPAFQPPRAEVEIQAPLPTVRGHPAAIVQCVSNILGNATKFVRPNTVPRIRIRAEVVGPAVRLWFEDNGIGIDPRHRGKIFGMFERVHGTRQYEGTGIGLAIVRKAVERMGGAVGVESELGQGSRFWIQLRAV